MDVVVGERAPALEQLFVRKDEALLGRGNALLVLDLGFHVVNGVGRLDIEGDGLASEGLHEDLHASAKTKHQMKRRLLLDVVVAEGATVLELLTREDETLLIGGDSLLVLDLGFDVVDGVRGLDIEGDGLAGESLHEDLHASAQS